MVPSTTVKMLTLKNHNPWYLGARTTGRTLTHSIHRQQLREAAAYLSEFDMQLHQRMMERQQHQLSSFPNLRVCLSNCICHSFPNLKICLVKSSLPQITQKNSKNENRNLWTIKNDVACKLN